MNTKCTIFLKQICLLALLFVAPYIYAQQDKEPLLIVDSMEVSHNLISAIDPSFVKDFKVLKGKDALDLYGEKGKNGVVLITLMSKEEVTSKSTIGKKVAEMLKKEGWDDNIKIVYWLNGKELSANEAKVIAEKSSRDFSIDVKKEAVAHVTLQESFWIR